MVKAPLYTRALAYTAVQTAFLAFLFSYYDVEIPLPDLTPAKHWLYEKIDDLDWFDFILRFADNVRSVGKKEKSGKTTGGKDIIILSPEQLAKYDGTRGSKGTYLAILGKVYNVEKGIKHYGPGGGYHFFSGKDATRAFVSGDFTEAGLIDDVLGLSYQDMLGIEDWDKFYAKDYEFVGYVHGTYYDTRGKPTARLAKAQAAIEAAHKWKEGQQQESEIFPPCNSEWHKDQGGRVWCSNKSGGIQRDWSGVPRKLFKAGSKDHRCACVKNFGAPLAEDPTAEHKNRGDLLNPNLQEYEGCSPTSNSCKLIPESDSTVETPKT